MKKLGILLLVAVFAVCGLAVFSACDEPGHTHSFGDWKVVAEPTCTEEGLRERVCACGEKESEEIAAIGHTPSEAIKENEVAATCTAGGSYEEVVYCAACGEELSRKAVEVVSLGHDYVKGVCARCGEAEPYTEGLIFELSGDGASYAVTGYKGTSTEVYIPSYYQGLPVTSIGNNAFYECEILESVTISDTVSSIGFGVFSACPNLTSISIDPQNPIYHSDGNCLIKTESKWLVYGCKTSIIPSDGSVTIIGNGAFYQCSSLSDIAIPDSVTSIILYAFRGCSGLESVTIGKGLASINVGVFGGCTSLTNISVDPQNPVYHSTGSHLIETKSKSLIAVCRGSMIPTDGSVTSIGDGAFMDCTWLESILIPDSVTSIRDEAFYGCSSLTSVTIPDSVTYIGGRAFQGCSNLESIVVPDSVTSIGGNAFTDTAFYNDRSNWDRNMLYLGGHLIKAEESSSGYYSIREGTINIAGSAFMSCNLRSIIIPNSVVSIGDSAFSWCDSLTSITIPDGVTFIHDFAFDSCSELESVMIGDSVTIIGNGAFYGCSSLTSVTIPDSVTAIGNRAFNGCDSLTSITIPDSVTYIGDYAFYSCDSLETVYYRGSEEEWNEIEIGRYNDKLENAEIVFNYKGE